MPRTAASLLLVASACAGPDATDLTSEGYAALGSGDSARAVACFEGALARLRDDGVDDADERTHVTTGLAEALAYRAPARALRTFEQLAFRPGGPAVTPGELVRVARAFFDAGAEREATALLTAGRQVYPGVSRIAELEQTYYDEILRADLLAGRAWGCEGYGICVWMSPPPTIELPRPDPRPVSAPLPELPAVRPTYPLGATEGPP